MTFQDYWKTEDKTLIEGNDLEVEDYSRASWKACRDEVLKILKTKENFIGSGITTAIKEVERL